MMSSQMESNYLPWSEGHDFTAPFWKESLLSMIDFLFKLFKTFRTSASIITIWYMLEWQQRIVFTRQERALSSHPEGAESVNWRGVVKKSHIPKDSWLAWLKRIYWFCQLEDDSWHTLTKAVSFL